MTFSIKIPIAPFHIWLPEAHVEAPTIGSVILAGLLLKLGSYGLIRINLFLFPLASNYFAPFVISLCGLSALYASFATIRQIDLKKIIAYSSIVHMNLMIIGLFCNTYLGFAGAILCMLSHGLISPALFFLVGFLYERTGSRLFRYFSGLVHLLPVYSTIFIFFVLANVSFPGTFGFVGEFLLILGLLPQGGYIVFLVLLSLFGTTAFNI